MNSPSGLKENMAGPRPCLEWQITTKCNYACDYCCSGTNSMERGEHCTDEVIAAVSRLLSGFSCPWEVKLIGGEPMVHPKIFSIAETIAQSQHSLCLTTNFSLPLASYEKLADTLGEKLKFLGASLHLGQTNTDDFIQRAVAFKKLKHPKTDFFVTTVLLENDVSLYQKTAEQFEKHGIRFELQPYKVDGIYQVYRHGELRSLSSKLLKNQEKIRGKNLFGTLCFAGCLFLFINIRGEANRCYNPQLLYRLGNLRKEKFKLLATSLPCLSPACTCTVPVNHGMILFGKHANPLQFAQAFFEGIKRRFFLISRA